MTVSRSDTPAFEHSDRVAAAFGLTWALLGSTLALGWVREAEGASALVTRVPVAGLNGVWAAGTDWDAGEVRAMLADVAREGVPFCLQTRPSRSRSGQEIADELGMKLDHSVPLMVATAVPEVADPVGLSFRALSPAEAPMHCELAGPAFGGTPELFAAVMTGDMFALREVHAYAGEVDRQAAVTAITVTVRNAVGIFNVATAETHRRRGYGAAITALAAREGFRRGADIAWLQSSAAGYGVYERLGFKTVERWPCWVHGL